MQNMNVMNQMIEMYQMNEMKSDELQKKLDEFQMKLHEVACSYMKLYEVR